MALSLYTKINYDIVFYVVAITVVVISILISFQLVFMMLTIFSSILVIVRERFLKIVVITVCKKLS